MKKKPFQGKQFLLVCVITSIWIHISEVFRYFVLVMPQIKVYFDNQRGIAEMNLGIFCIWGLWDTLLTLILVFSFYLLARSFGNHLYSVIGSATFVWLAVFVIFWVAIANMGLSPWSLLLITLPLSWLEMVLGAWIASRLYAGRLD